MVTKSINVIFTSLIIIIIALSVTLAVVVITRKDHVHRLDICPDDGPCNKSITVNDGDFVRITYSTRKWNTTLPKNVVIKNQERKKIIPNNLLLLEPGKHEFCLYHEKEDELVKDEHDINICVTLKVKHNYYHLEINVRNESDNDLKVVEGTDIQLLYGREGNYDIDFPKNHTIKHNNIEYKLNETLSLGYGEYNFCIYDDENRIAIAANGDPICSKFTVIYDYYEPVLVCQDSDKCGRYATIKKGTSVYLLYGQNNNLPLDHIIKSRDDDMIGTLDSDLTLDIGEYEFCVFHRDVLAISERNGLPVCAKIDVEHEYHQILICTDDSCGREMTVIEDTDIKVLYGDISTYDILNGTSTGMISLQPPKGHNIKTDVEDITPDHTFKAKPGNHDVCLYQSNNLVLNDSGELVCSKLTVSYAPISMKVCKTKCKSCKSTCRDSLKIKRNDRVKLDMRHAFEMPDMPDMYSYSPSYHNNELPPKENKLPSENHSIRIGNMTYNLDEDISLNVGYHEACVYHYDKMALNPSGHTICARITVSHEYDQLLLCLNEECKREQVIEISESLQLLYDGTFPLNHTIKVRDVELDNNNSHYDILDNTFHPDEYLDLPVGRYEICIYDEDMLVIDDGQTICVKAIVKQTYDKLFICNTIDGEISNCVDTKKGLQTDSFILSYGLISDDGSFSDSSWPEKHVIKSRHDDKTFSINEVLNLNVGDFEFCIYKQNVIVSNIDGDPICAKISLNYDYGEILFQEEDSVDEFVTKTYHNKIKIVYNDTTSDMPPNHNIKLRNHDDIINLDDLFEVNIGIHEVCLYNQDDHMVLNKNGRVICSTLEVEKFYGSIYICQSENDNHCVHNAIISEGESIYLTYRDGDDDIDLPPGHIIKHGNNEYTTGNDYILDKGEYKFCLYVDNCLVFKNNYDSCAQLNIYSNDATSGLM